MEKIKMSKSYDDALNSHAGGQIPGESSYFFSSFINSQVQHSNLLLERQIPSDTRSTIRVKHNSAIWKRLIDKRDLFATNRVTLSNFYIFEWFPLSPGLYHTRSAKRSRDNAYYNISHMEDDIMVFNPHGKSSMIEGGIGNIRLKPRMIEDDFGFFMTASSTHVCHEGFPIFLSFELYNSVIGEIQKYGVAARKISGEMRFLPMELETLFHTYRDVPQLYLKVNSLSLPEKGFTKRPNNVVVSVAVSFDGVVDGRPGIYWTYVNFNPAKHWEERERLRWLKDTYVSKSYNGTIVTDFDEQMQRYPYAVFSLQAIMDGRLTKDSVRDFTKKYLRDKTISKRFFSQYNNIKEINMTKYENINLNNSILATEKSIVTGSINVRESGRENIAEAIEQLVALIKETDKKHLSAQDKADALEMLDDITQKASQPSPNKRSLKALGNGLWEIIGAVEPLAKGAKKIWDLISSLWQ